MNAILFLIFTYSDIHCKRYTAIIITTITFFFKTL